MKELSLKWTRSNLSFPILLSNNICNKLRITISGYSTFVKSSVKVSQIFIIKLNVLAFQVFKQS